MTLINGHKEIVIRPEQPADIADIHAVHRAAFPSDAEARLVDSIRQAGRATISLVAEAQGKVIGHSLWSPVTVGDLGDSGGLGLAPVAVAPAWQQKGVGGELIRAGLKLARDAGHPYCVVLGHPEYYPRFGFRRAKDLGLDNEYGADEAFMVVELIPGGLSSVRGVVRYCPEFAALG